LDKPWELADGLISQKAVTYDLRRDDRLADLEGRLFVEWGDGLPAWVQRADLQNKAIGELRAEFYPWDQLTAAGWRAGLVGRVENGPSSLRWRLADIDRALGDLAATLSG
jgi:hypothetical protein